jgi:hypothetical protein
MITPHEVTAAAQAGAAYSIRPYAPDDIAAVLELARASLGDQGAVRKSEEFWRWKHHANPFGDSLGVCAWMPDGQLVGLRILLRWQLVHPQGGEISAARAVDTATHAGYRRLGIFSALTRRMVADLPAHGVGLIFNTPNAQSLPGYLKLGWQVAARWPLYLRPLRPWRMLRRAAGVGVPQPEDAVAGLDRVRPWATFWDDYGDQVASVVAASEQGRAACGWRTPRTLDYLTWRYGRHPSIQYGVHVLTAAGDARRLLGFALLRPNVRQGWQELVLADLFLAQWQTDPARRLLHGLARAVQADYVIAHFAEASRERDLLRRTGFWRVPQRRLVFTVMPLQDIDPLPVEARQWDMSLGDLELF